MGQTDVHYPEPIAALDRFGRPVRAGDEVWYQRYDKRLRSSVLMVYTQQGRTILVLGTTAGAFQVPSVNVVLIVGGR